MEGTYQNDVVIELAFVLAFAVHFGHLLEAVKHTLNDFLVRSVHTCSNLQIVGINKLVLHFADVYWEILDEVSNTLAFLACQLGLLDTLDLIIL